MSLAGSTFAFTGASNGSFETGTFDAQAFDTLSAGSTAITDWTVDSGTIDWIGTYWTASNGSRSIDLNGFDAGTISQTLATTIGNTYVVTFDLSGNPVNLPTTKTLNVVATGGPTVGYTYDTLAQGNTQTDMKWVPQTYSFFATSSSTVLSFASTTAGAFGPALDNVAVTEVAATKNDCKDGGWVSMLDSQGNSFKNQGDCVSFFATGGKNLGSVAPLTAAAPAPVAATGGTTGPSAADVKRTTHTRVHTSGSSTKSHAHAGATKVKTHGAHGNH
jgi:choice-of-anchor C domain-containing protein